MPVDVNIIDIAKFAGVSVSTVSRVLNNHPDVSAKTRQKVLHVIEEHSYIPNNSARNLKRESMHAVGVVVKGFTNPFFTRMMQVVQKQLESRKYTVLLHPVEPNQDEIEAAVSLNKEKKPKGLIFLGGNFQHAREKLALLDVPFVMATISMHKNVDRTCFSSVTIDDFAESYRMTDHICKVGHRQVALIGHLPGDKSISRLRRNGFEQAMQDNGIHLNDNNFAYAGRFTMKAGYEAAQKLLAAGRFTCLFCISDILALGAMRAIHEAGLRIPQDISVVGFDGIDAGLYAIPSLASVKQPDETMAGESVHILLDILENGAPHRHEIFPAQFQQGESFGPPAAQSLQVSGQPATGGRGR